MPKPTPWEDEYTLLCERCGYAIEGLDQSGNCPECGKPVAESLPERRIGTPWQRKPGVGSLLATWWMTLRHPLRTLDVMRVRTDRRELMLSASTIIVASLILATGFVLPAVFTRDEVATYPAENPRPYPYWDILVTIPFFAVVPLVIFPILTWIETRGLIVIGKARGFRIDARLAKSIVAHACAGWLLLAILYLGLNSLGSLLIHINETPPTPGPEPTSTEDRVMQYVDLFSGAAPQWTYWVNRIFWIGGLLIGFLFFETFAFLGLRRCKYANRVRPANPDEPRP